jgi:hypothetical protein
MGESGAVFILVMENAIGYMFPPISFKICMLMSSFIIMVMWPCLST